MRVEIVQNGRALPTTYHEGKYFVEAPLSGDYAIRITNNLGFRRLAVTTVDGKNVIDGEPGSYNGGGYVLQPWASVTIPGWHRSNQEVAKFSFTPSEGSYASQMGDGVKNTGVIGVAVFDERQRPVMKGHSQIIRHSRHESSDVDYGMKGIPVSAGGTARGMSFSEEAPENRARGCAVMDGYVEAVPCAAPACAAAAAPELGTAYGEKSTFFTEETTFQRATSTPALLIDIRYAVRAKLVEWGVPVHEPIPDKSAFPSEQPGVPAPPGWRG